MASALAPVAIPAATPVSAEVRGRRALVIRLVLAAATLTVGGREIGNNGGALVNGWQAITGNGTGDAWCLSWAVAIIVRILAAVWPALGRSAFPLPLTASCDAMLIAARKLGIAHDVGPGLAEPLVGDLVLRLAPGSTTDATHAMLVSEDVPGTAWGTIEGNTNDDGSREGYEVCRHTHGGAGDATRYVAVRWADALVAPPLLAA